MKKRFYSLLVFGLVLCMTLAIPTTALAVIKYNSTSEALPEGTELPYDAQVYADKPGVVIYDYQIKQITVSIETGHFLIQPEESEGYAWRITKNFDDGEGKTYVNLVRTPIHYTLEYYDSDQTTLLYKQENITVENAEHYTFPIVTKEGYIFSHWIPVSGGGRVSAGSAIDPFFIASHGHPNHNYVIKMVASWTNLPVTGDDTPIGLWVMLMIASLTCSAGLFVRWKRGF